MDSAVPEALCFRTAFERLRHETGDMLVAFLIGKLIEKVERCPHFADWQEQPYDEQGATELMAMATHVLEELAANLAGSSDDAIYKDATAVARELHGVLTEVYEFPPFETVIESPRRFLEALVPATSSDDFT